MAGTISFEEPKLEKPGRGRRLIANSIPQQARSRWTFRGWITFLWLLTLRVGLALWPEDVGWQTFCFTAALWMAIFSGGAKLLIFFLSRRNIGSSEDDRLYANEALTILIILSVAVMLITNPAMGRVLEHLSKAKAWER